LEELGPIKVVEIWHSPHTVAAQTAKAYEWAISARTQRNCSPAPMPLLDPDTGSAAQVVELVAKRHVPDGSAIILVGHQPMLTAVAGALTRKRLPAGTLPLGGSEAACMEMCEGKAATLLWMLTEKSDDLLKDLKDKIKSKYDVAKFFLGAFVVNTGFLFSSTIWGGVSDAVALWLIMAGFVLALIALALTAATLMAYDELQMPIEFWTEPPAGGRRNGRIPRPKKWSVLRPPSQAHVVLFYEMIHAWNAFFLPALGCAGASIALIIVAMAHSRFKVIEPGLTDLVVLVMIIVAAAALLVPLVIYYPHKAPKLGFED
jgi:phosphohistidine phosphatase SixA